jgi:glycosyltransferase involved in cell wall biosynthesis
MSATTVIEHSAAVEAFSTRRNRAPHIVIIVENMPVPADRRVWQEATSLAQAGWQVSVICPKAGKYTASRETLEGVDIYRHPLPFEANGMLGYILEYGAALFFETLGLFRIGLRNIDVVQICNPPDFLFMPAMLAKAFGGAKVIFDHHDLTPELLVEKTGKASGTLLKFAHWAERQTFRLADRVISTNEAFRKVAMERGGKAHDDTSVVYSAPDLARFPIVAPKTELKNDASTLILWIGIIGSQDGVDLLLEAVKALKHDLGVGDFHVLVAGDGPEREALIAYAEELGVGDEVSFPGFLSGDDFAAAFCTADIGVGSDPKNDFNDQLAMNKVMEYMAYSLPIAMFDLTECMRIAGPAALTAGNNDPKELAAQLKTLIEDEALRDELGKVGRARLEQSYSWKQQKEIYLETCHAVLEAEPCPE